MAMSTAKSTIPKHLNEQFFKTAIEYGMREVNISVVSFQIRDITKAGENYCSNIYQVTVQFKHPKALDLQTQQLIVKVMPVEKQGVLKRLNVYCKETFFYVDVKPKVEALMMLMTEDWQFGARHYYSAHMPEETIVLEDLGQAGYELKCRQTGLDMQQSELVLKKLAQYHAATIFMQHKDPFVIKNRYPFGLLNSESIKTDHFKALFGAQLLKLANILAKLDDYKTIASKLLKYHEQFMERVLKAVYPLEGAINVLNHGDLWVNNIFFESQRATPQHVQFIDFQLCFWGSLGFDVNYFLYTSVQLDVLRHHRQTLLEFYCETLLTSLSKLQPYEKAQPKAEQIFAEIEQREAYGFFVSFAFFPLISMIAIDSANNSLENLQNEEFARAKIDLMFTRNPRTIETLKYAVKWFDDLGIFD